MNRVSDFSPLDRRRGGVLLHPTSLPGPGDTGILGPEAYRFVDFLGSCGVSVWQTLPLGPTHRDGSPYRCRSAHAGNERLISLELLTESGWLAPDAGPGADESFGEYRKRRLQEARAGFQRDSDTEARADFERFLIGHAHWLDDYALYQTLRHVYRGVPWWRWPAELRDRRQETLEHLRALHQEEFEQSRFEQFLFFRQWCALKRYANEHGIRMFGDLPLFVAEDSADVWAHRDYFRLRPDGKPDVVAGVPPDYFSETGQRWGNPHYDWEAMRRDGFRWWLDRIGTQLEQFDLLRIDHFRGLEAAWEIASQAKDAIEGHWVKTPGAELLQALRDTYERLPLVAEDLGIITPEVEALRDRFGLPGMKILQFAFGGGSDNPYLPHNHSQNSVVYTGTHDNNTSLGWFMGLEPKVRQHVLDYFGCSADAMPLTLCRAAFSSVSRLAIVPMQDLLRLGSDQRMNTPGTRKGNWAWRFSWKQVPDGLSEQYRSMLALYGRA